MLYNHVLLCYVYFIFLFTDVPLFRLEKSRVNPQSGQSHEKENKERNEQSSSMSLSDSNSLEKQRKTSRKGNDYHSER
jgi:hypothetical protein